MGTGTSIVLVAVGAILRFAVSATTSGFDVQTVGLILMIVGAVGLILSILYWSSWGGFGGAAADDGAGGTYAEERGEDFG
jgi:hypothetical protein